LDRDFWRTFAVVVATTSLFVENRPMVRSAGGARGSQDDLSESFLSLAFKSIFFTRRLVM
jgi:hypothetical protein